MHFRQEQSAKKTPVYAKCNSLVNTRSGGRARLLLLYAEEGKASLGKCLPVTSSEHLVTKRQEVSIHTWSLSHAFAA
jgi:hypothetical protein